jgi:hypothetical protein
MTVANRRAGIPALGGLGKIEKRCMTKPVGKN